MEKRLFDMLTSKRYSLDYEPSNAAYAQLGDCLVHERSSLTIGRGNCDIQINPLFGGVSRLHAGIYFNEEAATVIDLGSKCGTEVQRGQERITVPRYEPETAKRLYEELKGPNTYEADQRLREFLKTASKEGVRLIPQDIISLAPGKGDYKFQYRELANRPFNTPSSGIKRN